jgi:hypothetical protein
MLVPVLAVIGASTPLIGTTAAAAPSSSPIRLVAASGSQTIERYKGEPVFLYDLGLYEVADQGFEIRTSRSSFATPVNATLTVGQGQDATTRALPPGLMKYADHIPDFYGMNVKNAAGKVVLKEITGFCPNSYSAARANPAAVPTSPYPQGCGDHPFARGGVFGIAAGWSAPALDDFSGSTGFDGRDGTYTLTLTVRPVWRRALGISVTDATTTIKVKVKTVPGDATGFPGSASTAQAGAQAHQHVAPTGVLSPQRVALEAARLRAQGVANTPAARAPESSSVLSRAAAAAAGPMPDLRSLPAYQIGLNNLDAKGRPSKKTYIDFGATVWNSGPSPLVVDGFRRPGTKIMDAYQYFFDAQGNEVGSAPAGTLQFDSRPGHNHWHFTAFASYRLLNADRSVAVRSGKEAFCLAPTDPVNLNLDGANWRPAATGLETACGSQGALSIREVLDAGWGDTYGQYLPGQSFDVTKLPKGIYYIQVLANPDGKLAESSSANNSSLRKIKLGGDPGGRRSLKVYPYQGIAAP